MLLDVSQTSKQKKVVTVTNVFFVVSGVDTAVLKSLWVSASCDSKDEQIMTEILYATKTKLKFESVKLDQFLKRQNQRRRFFFFK